MNLLERGSNWLQRQRTRHMTRDVIYLRGSDSIEVKATVGRTIFRVDKGYGVMERIEARDYLILAKDLSLNGAQVLPKAGDRIQETESGKTFSYEVLAPGNEPCWRFSELYRVTFRIHTKLVGVDSV